jgi:chromosome segregation ATPase
MQDDHGHPDQNAKTEGQESRIAPDAQAEQTISLSTNQAAQQLGVKDSRTVRRYITEGIHAADGSTIHLKARQVRTNRGPEYQIYQTDLDAFKQIKDQAATEGQEAGELTRQVQAQGSQSQALTTSIQLFAVELERRSQELERRAVELAEAQKRIEQLAYEAGRQQGRNEELEHELLATRQYMAAVQQERDYWQQQAAQSQRKPPHRIRLLGWGNKGDDHRGQQ